MLADGPKRPDLRDRSIWVRAGVGAKIRVGFTESTVGSVAAATTFTQKDQRWRTPARYISFIPPPGPRSTPTFSGGWDSMTCSSSSVGSCTTWAGSVTPARSSSASPPTESRSAEKGVEPTFVPVPKSCPPAAGGCSGSAAAAGRCFTSPDRSRASRFWHSTGSDSPRRGTCASSSHFSLTSFVNMTFRASPTSTSLACASTAGAWPTSGWPFGTG